MMKLIWAKLRQPGLGGAIRAIAVACICLGGLLLAAHIYAANTKTRTSPVASLDSQCAKASGVMLGGHCIRQSAIIQLKR